MTKNQRKALIKSFIPGAAFVTLAVLLFYFSYKNNPSPALTFEAESPDVAVSEPYENLENGENEISREETQSDEIFSIDYSNMTLYYTKSGKKWHSDRSCRYITNSTTVYESTLTEAEQKGLTPCSACVKQ